MRHFEVNWKSKILTPGFLLLVSLLLADINFGLSQSITPLQWLFCLVIALYLVFLLFHKHRQTSCLVFLVLFVALISFAINQNQQNFSLKNSSVVTIYPDQIKVSGNRMFGQGKADGKSVLVSTKISQMQKKELLYGYSLYLSHLQGEVKEIEPATNYGQFDAKKYYLSKNIKQKIELENCIITNKKQHFRDVAHHIRFCLQKYFAQMPPILSFFSSELVLGESPSQADQSILSNYRDLGVIHLLSISGLHVGIYTLVISTICYYLKLTEQETFAICLFILLIGIFLSNSQAGFIRASLTYILDQIFKFQKQKITHFDLLGLTYIIHLIINPCLMLNVGAILSYVLALGLELTTKITSFKQSFALNCLLTPLLLFHFFQFNLLTVFFNLVVVPYFNWLVMPIVFLNLATFKLCPEISWWFENVLMTCEKLIAQVSASKLGLLTFGKINWWQCVMLTIFTAILLVFVNEQKLTKKSRLKAIGGIAALYVMIFSSIHFPLTGQVTLIDVGQGDSIFISTPFPRRVYLIDVGGKLNFSGQKATPQVNKITIPFLKALGISKLNGVFVTHQDSDHVGDLRPLLEQVHVQKLYTAAGLIRNPSFIKRIVGQIKRDQVVELLAGQKVAEPQITFNVVYPFKPGLGKNEDSLSLTFVVKSKRWLFTGDLGQEGEKEIMNKFNIKADYFKLGHHGSRTSSNPDFLKALKPKLVFISAGRNNRFGHPHKETLDTLSNQHIPWASTQDCGMITWTYGYFSRPKFKRFVVVNQK